jgi:hypothetical protein
MPHCFPSIHELGNVHIGMRHAFLSPTVVLGAPSAAAALTQAAAQTQREANVTMLAVGVGDQAGGEDRGRGGASWFAEGKRGRHWEVSVVGNPRGHICMIKPVCQLVKFEAKISFGVISLGCPHCTQCSHSNGLRHPHHRNEWELSAAMNLRASCMRNSYME